MRRGLLSLSDLSRNEFIDIFRSSLELKASLRKSGRAVRPLAGKTLGMIFEKPSTRTSISFAVGMYQLGGLPLILSAQDLQLYRGESITDTARVLSRYVDIIMIRANTHRSLLELASRADVPVINGLTDLEHPCQILADILTIIEKKYIHAAYPRRLPKRLPSSFWKNLSFKDLKVAYVGDGNNVTNSWILAASILGMDLSVACPERYDPDQGIWKAGIKKASGTGARLSLHRDPIEAVRDADVVYTDVWASMGHEKEKEVRRKVFRPYQVNAALLSHAKKDALVMHCLPAHRGEEITDEVIDGGHSVVFDEAENRLHVQKAVILKLVTGHYSIWKRHE